MTARASFKQADVTRAVKGAVKAGLKPSQCLIDSAGTIRLVFTDDPATGLPNPLDRLLTR